MRDSEIAPLAARWVAAKEAEALAVNSRRLIEDQIKQIVGLTDEFDGQETLTADAYVVKISCRLDRKVNAELLQDLAAEHGLTDHLSSLFRWKPDINMTAWRSADESITWPLSEAITTKPGRASFSITFKE